MRDTHSNGRGTSVLALVSVAGALIAATACSGEPKSGGAEAAQGEQRAAVGRSGYSPLTYPLDEAKVRKVAAVMREWDPTGAAPKSEDPKELAAYWGRMRAGVDLTNAIGRELMNENSTATIDKTPELKAAIRRQGMSSREFAEAMLAYTNAQGALDMEGLEKMWDMAGIKDDKSSAKSSASSNLQKMMTGVFKENVELMRRMSKEEDLPSW